jgi:spore cortex biosynthesis protein YabQ
MELYLARQTVTFGYACLLGAALGAVYDLFRLLRIARAPRRGVVFVQDLVFFLFCAVATFLFLLIQNEGVIRAFLLIGELLGAIIYSLTLGGLMMRAGVRVLHAVKKLLAFVRRHILQPIWRFFYGIVAMFLRPIRFLWKKLKKSSQRSRFRLKTQRLVLYNHIMGYWDRKRPRKHQKEKRSDEAKKKS